MRSLALTLQRNKNMLFPLDIVYEPTISEKNLFCYYSDNICLARSFYSKKRKGKEVTEHPPARQCYYCDNVFSRRESGSCITGIAYKRNNQKIESFQKKLSFNGRFAFCSLF